MNYRLKIHKRHTNRDRGETGSLYGESSDNFMLPNKNFFHIDDSLEIAKSYPQKRDSIKKDAEKRLEDNNTVAKFLNLGYYIITPLIVGIFFGLLLDKALNSTIYVKIFLFVGIAGTFYNLIRIVRETK